MIPIFKHDCDGCTFLGHNKQATKDLYYCPQRGFPTVIARFGNEGRDYMSGIAFKDSDVDIAYAVELAKEKGLL
jgi:hypothetical protein